MQQLKTPDVYIRERSVLPPSVAQVATAIPVFVGYTEVVTDAAGQSITQKPTRITSMADFVSIFGGPYAENFIVNENGHLITGAGADNDKLLPDFMLFQSVQSFFANGGGLCYVVSVGDFGTPAPALTDFQTALSVIKHVDEVTLLVLSDAINLSAIEYYTAVQGAIAQSSKLQDRFTLVDVQQTEATETALLTDITAMRNNVVGDIKYSAAYAPYVTTVTPRAFTDASVTVRLQDGSDTILEAIAPEITDPADATATIANPNANTELYFRVKAQLNSNFLVLPASAAVAGVYASTDASRGVWKAPANVALRSVVGPIVTIDNDLQEDMNVDPTSGKSVNAIRAFTGKGTLVWGARTLAGNDNEWRYISVRRLFNMVEESVKKSTQFAVFEPNTPFTWLKIQTLIESFLENLWRQGALFGESTDQAFFVNVGLGQTMTEDDINNGIMNVEIGLAAVRPAEFIVLTFSHKSLEG